MEFCLRTFVLSAGGAVVFVISGCGRPAPIPHRVEHPRQATSTGQLPVESDATDVPAALGKRAAIRDEAVMPASADVEVPPKSEGQLAADALSLIGPPAVPTLVEALHSSDFKVRRQACAVLMRMGPDAKDAVPDLVALLDDPDAELRRMAAIALGRIGPDAGQAVPALMRQMLNDVGSTPRLLSAPAAETNQ